MKSLVFLTLIRIVSLPHCTIIVFESHYVLILDMDVSQNSGTPKSSILIGFSIINHPFWGIHIFGNTHIWSCSFCYLQYAIYKKIFSPNYRMSIIINESLFPPPFGREPVILGCSQEVRNSCMVNTWVTTPIYPIYSR